jgi:hypothetical protein
LPVFALPPAEFLRILMGPDASHTQNSIAAVSAEAARQRCGNATVPACFPWTIAALFDRPKREEPSEFCRVFGPWTAGDGGVLLLREAERKHGVCLRLAEAMPDRRDRTPSSMRCSRW